MKITLDSIISGFKSVTKLIANFDSIESELNDKVLYRDNPDGEPNQMNTELDMNSKSLKNLPSPTNDNDAARWIDVKNGVTTLDAPLPTLSGNTDRALSTDGASLVFKDGDDLSFTNTAAGATRRTLGAKISEIVSVEDFGAVGNGTTDDLASINSALATGEAISFKAGTVYRVSGLPNFTNAVIVANGASLLVDSGIYTNVSAQSFSQILGTLKYDCAAGATAFSATGITSSSGSINNYSVELTCSDTSGISVGDYVSMRSTGVDRRQLNGYHEVTAIIGNTSVTLAVTSEYVSNPFPTGAFAGTINFFKYEVQLEFAAGSYRSFSVDNGSLEFAGEFGMVSGAGNLQAIYATNRASIRQSSSKLAIAKYVTGVSLNDGSSFFGASELFLSSCTSSCIQLLNNCYFEGSGGIILGANSGTGLIANKSVIAMSALYVNGTNSVAVASDNASGFITSINAYNEQGVGFNTGITCSNSSSLKVNGIIDGYYIGASLIDNSILNALQLAIKNCTTGADVSRQSDMDFRLGTFTGNTVNTVVATGGTFRNTSDGVETGNVEHLTLTDGASIPVTSAGNTYIYVDSADGDLKVKFGDGTVKTISVDT